MGSIRDITDLILRAGDAQAQRAAVGGSVWGRTVMGLGDLAVQSYQQRQKDQQLAQEQRASDERMTLARNADARATAQDTREANAFTAQSAAQAQALRDMTHEKMVRAMGAVRTAPDAAKPQVWAQTRAAIIGQGWAKPADVPAQYPGDEAVDAEMRGLMSVKEQWDTAHPKLENVPEGGTLVNPYTGATVANGAPKSKNEWESFQDAYAAKTGGAGKGWGDLSPDQRLQGVTQFGMQKQDPAVAALAAESKELSVALQRIQLGQQPTKEDAQLFAGQMRSHKIAPSQVAAMGGMGTAGAAWRRMVNTEALKQDPAFDWEQAESEYQFAKSPGFQTTVRYMDSVQESMPRLLENAKKLGNSNIRIVNGITNFAKTQINDPTLKAFVTDALLVGDEGAKILQGGGTGSATSDSKLNQMVAIINTSDSVPSIAAALREINSLIGFRRKSLTRGTYMEGSSAPGANTVDTAAAGAPMVKPIPGIPGAEATSTDGGKTWTRSK